MYSKFTVLFSISIILFSISCQGQTNERKNKNNKTEQYLFLVEKGYSLMKEKRGAESIAALDEAIAVLPDSSQAYAAKGYYYLGAKRFFLSLENFDKAIKKGNKEFSLYFCRAHVLWDIKNYSEAMKELDHVIFLNKNYPDAIYLKGRLLARTEKFKEALPYYDQALKLEPASKLPEVYGYRGVAYLALKEYVKAEEDLLRAINGGMDRDEITFALTEVDRYNYLKK